MNRKLRIAVVLGTALLTTCGIVLPRASARGQVGDAAFTLTEHYSAPTFVSISHATSPQPGDEFLFHVRLTKDGVRVGSLEVVCQVVLRGRLQCASTYNLPGGTLSVATLTALQGQPTIHNSITGGTGRYDAASGQVTEVQHNADNASTFTATFDTD
jgi:hypothetical protein